MVPPKHLRIGHKPLTHLILAQILQHNWHIHFSKGLSHNPVISRQLRGRSLQESFLRRLSAESFSVLWPSFGREIEVDFLETGAVDHVSVVEEHDEAAEVGEDEGQVGSALFGERPDELWFWVVRLGKGLV